MDDSTCVMALWTLYLLGASLMFTVVRAFSESGATSSASSSLTFMEILSVIVWPVIVLAVLIKQSYNFLKS